jgi:hypothetical protein
MVKKRRSSSQCGIVLKFSVANKFATTLSVKISNFSESLFKKSKYDRIVLGFVYFSHEIENVFHLKPLFT